MVLEMKKREARVKIKKEQENPSTIPPDILGPSSEPAQHTDRKGQEVSYNNRKVCLSVPSSKGTPIQESGRPWYRGYGTIQD